MSMGFVFEGGRVVDPAAGVDDVRDVVVAGGLIAGPEAAEGAERIDARGLVIAPGLVDLHTHLREPGDEHKETVATGTRAAAVGGYTAVAAMANTQPVADNAAVIQAVRELAAAAGLCEVHPVGAITKGLQGEQLAEMGEMVEAGVRVFSDDGHPVPTARLLRNALLYVKAFGGEVVLAELTPHHLTFTDEDLHTYEANLKVNPPLRSAEDRDALRAGLADGTIDAIATDHAPHAIEEKEAEFDRAPPGTIGLETALGAILTELVHPGRLPLSRALEALSTVPARILGAGDHGGPIEPGRPANLVVFDPDHAWVVEPPFASKGRNTAFLGRQLRGRVTHTVFRGALVVAEGKPTR